MDEFLALLVQFPTIVYAVMLCVSLFYWGLVIVGAAHLNPFHGAEGAVKGAVHGAAHGVAGAVKGAAHVATGHAHVDVAQPNALTQALGFLGLTKVPITISFSVFSLFAWFISIATRQAADPALGATWSTLLATAASIVGGFVAAAAISKPIAGIFTETTSRTGSASLTGRVVKVTTEIVDAERGQGEIDDGAAGIVVSIRTPPGVVLQRGDDAIVIELDEKTGTYLVEPHKNIAPTEAELLAAPIAGAVVDEKPVEVASTRGRT